MKRLPRTFQALGHRGFRYLWMGQLGHSAALWMEQVVRPLLILELTHSPLQVGLVVSVRMIPQLLFGLLAGVVADRYERLRVLMVSQLISMTMHLALAFLLFSGRIAVWQVFATAFISGASMAFNQPARQTLIPALVPGDMVLNAVALNTAAMNVMRVFGAGLAGVLLISFDYGQVYLLNALLFIFVLWTTQRIQTVLGLPTDSTSREKIQARGIKTLFQDLIEGFRYMGENRLVLSLVGLAMILFVIGFPYHQVFIPLIALKVFQIGRPGAGWMLALTGIGALTGSLVMASIKKLKKRGLFLMFFLVAFGTALIVLSQSRWLIISSMALIFAGAMTTAYHSLNISLLLEKTPREFQGRVLSLMSLDRGLVSLGAVVAGGLAEALGPRFGLLAMALACILFTFLFFIFFPTLKRLN